MDMHSELLTPLLDGLPSEDRSEIVTRINRAAVEQLHRKQDPPKRRRRGTDGELHAREELN